MAAIDYEDYCELWAEKTEVMEDESLTSLRFCLVFHVSFIHLPQNEDELLEIDSFSESAIETQAFWVPRAQLINNSISQETLEGIFSSMRVPSRPVFVDKILGYARAMANDKTRDEFKVLHIHVRMCFVVVVDANEEEEEEEGQ